MSNDQSLLDRVEMPSIPEAAMKKIAVLEEQFARAEVEQCMFLLVFYFVTENSLQRLLYHAFPEAHLLRTNC